MALYDPSRRPVGRVTPYDPGIFLDEAGNYFTGTKEADLQFASSDPRVFNIGGQTPAPPGGYGPESYRYRGPESPEPVEPPIKLPVSMPTPGPAPAAPAPGTGRVDWTQPFAPVPGFDWAKLIDQNKTNAKYTPDVRLFSQALAALGTPQRGQLQSFADWINQHGGQGVTAPGEDLLNFGGGPIDVLTGWGTPWFNNQPGPAAQNGPPPSGLSIAGPGAPTVGRLVPTETMPVARAGEIPAPPPVSIPPVALPPPTPQFQDAQTKFLEQFINARLKELLGPMTDPALDQYAKLLQERVNTLGQARPLPPEIGAFQQLLQQRIQALGEARPMPPELSAFQELLQRYGAELQGPAFSPRDLDLLQTQQIDPIEQDRQAAKEHAIARMAQRGIGPDSGLYQSLLNQVDLAFDRLRAQAHGQTALAAIQRGDQRRAEALGLSGQLASLATGRQDLEEQRRARGLGFGGQLASLASGLQDLEEERRREALQIAGGLTGITGGLRGEEQQRRQEALSLASLLTELPERRLQLANAIATGSQPPGSLFSALTQLYGIGTQGQLAQQQLGLQRQQNFFSGLGALARLFAGFGGGGQQVDGGSPNPLQWTF